MNIATDFLLLINLGELREVMFDLYIFWRTTVPEMGSEICSTELLRNAESRVPWNAI